MIRRTLDRSTMQPYERWNAYIDLIGTESYESLTPVQRVAKLVFAYESEVQNGGHLQYFLNSAGSLATEAVSALEGLGAIAQAQVLRDILIETSPSSSYTSMQTDNRI